MGYNKSLSAVYSDIWERYKHHCEGEGMIALNRYCEGKGINVQRLCSGFVAARSVSVIIRTVFRGCLPEWDIMKRRCSVKVRLPRPSHARGDAEAGTADVIRDIRIEFGGGRGHEHRRDRSQWPDDADGGSYTQRGCGGLSLISGCGFCQRPVSMRATVSAATAQMVLVVEGHSPASGDVCVFSQGYLRTMKALK